MFNPKSINYSRNIRILIMINLIFSILHIRYRGITWSLNTKQLQLEMEIE